jgi:hypothetical protein
MNNLHSLQNHFQNYLLSGQMYIEQSIIRTDKVSAKTRLGIYQDAYEARLIEALTNNFPCLHAYLGDEQFYDLGASYIAHYASNYRSIRWYGDKLSEFLPEYYDNAYPYLTELAQFEWAMTLIFDAADAPIVQLSDMATIPPESWQDMCFKAHPSLIRSQFTWNIIPIWEALNQNITPAAPLQNTHYVPWVLWRKDFINRFYALSADEAWAIDNLLKGYSFGELCEGLCQWHEETQVGLRAATLLKSWIESGQISTISWSP